MAKVFLRKYIREIEGQVDHGQQDEAIAHCRHILRKYPKHLDTYRMLGKAYLEARRYNEATDIFHRLLMAVPDDFVAHVGMSIINDVQQNMDAAIWHMERAFEVQPSNSAIQSEMQRLYNRRDGVEPPKIRLTRGALSHMYVQGELYPQAISEISGVLAEDAGRQDMQVLLARAYFHAGQKGESGEICSQLIRRYPYCLDANRVLVELLPGEEDSEKAQVYRARVIELDPYAAFVTGSIFRSEDVPDEAVSIDHLEWDGQPVEMDAEWDSNLGIGLTGGVTASGEQPSWLNAVSAEDIPGSPLPDEAAPAGKDSSDIPEFLRDAGWGASDGGFQEGESSLSGEAEPALEQGDLPDWVKAMAPKEEQSDENLTGSEAPAAEAGEAPDWLDSLQTPEAGSTPAESDTSDIAIEGDLPDWLRSQEVSMDQPPGTSGAAPAADAAGETLDEMPAGEDTPDWLGSMQADAGQTGTPPGEPGAGEDIPDWLGSMQADFGQAPGGEPASGAEAPDWLGSTDSERGLDQPWAEEPAGEVVAPEQPAEEEIAEDLLEAQAGQPSAEAPAPDWLERMQPEGVDASAAPVDAGVDEAAPDWLQSLKEGALRGTDQDEGITLDESDVPDWLKPGSDQGGAPAQPESFQAEPVLDENMLAGWLDEAEAGPAEGAEPAVYDKTDTGSLGKSETEQDEALSWLEGLAAKHGAKAEELLTQPEERAESEPAWVQQAKTLSGEPLLAGDAPEPEGEQQAGAALEQDSPAAEAEAEEPAGVETIDLGMSAADQEEALSWLEGLAAGHGAKPEELLTRPEERLTSEPEWVRQAKLQGEAQAEEQPPGKTADNDQTGIFMQGLAKSEDHGEPEQGPPAETGEPEPGVLPDWMTGLAGSEDAAGAAGSSEEDQRDTQPLKQVRIPVARDQDEPDNTARDVPAEKESFEERPAEDLPDWLAGLDDADQDAKPSAAPGELPEWLSETEEEGISEPEPVMPSDWHPADESEGAAQPAEQTSEMPEPSIPEEPVAQSQLLPPAPEVPGIPATEEPVAESTPPPQAPAAPVEATPEARPRKTGEFSEASDPVLVAAQAELSRGNIPGAMEGYSKLIKKGNLLDEVIFDLRGALLRYPVEVAIWQALGDAYMRTNRLQEALDAYTKAEEMLR